MSLRPSVSEAVDVRVPSDRLHDVLSIGAKVKPTRKPSPSRRAGPPLAGDPTADDPILADLRRQADADLKNYGETYVRAMYDDGVPYKFVTSHIADVYSLATAIYKNPDLATGCSPEEEEEGRREILLAVNAVKDRLGMQDWPLDALGMTSYTELCAFEALIFLANPLFLVRSNLALSRAWLREKLGQRKLCGFIDTALMCLPSESFSAITQAIGAKTFLNAVNQNHIDIVSGSGFMALTNNISQTFIDANTLAKMFMFVEELLFSNSALVSFKLARRAFEGAADADAALRLRTSVAAEIERNGKVAFVWAAMLYQLMFGEEMKGGRSDYEPYLEAMPLAMKTYMRVVFEQASDMWWADSHVLTTALHLINQVQVQAFQNASTPYYLFTGTCVRTALDTEESDARFFSSKTLRPLQIASAKTMVLAGATASLTARTLGTTLTVASKAATVALLATQTAGLVMAAAPATGVAAGLAVYARTIATIRERVSPAAADYAQDVMGSAARTGTRAAASAAAQGVREVAEEVIDPAIQSAVDHVGGSAVNASTTLMQSMGLGGWIMNRTTTGAPVDPAQAQADAMRLEPQARYTYGLLGVVTSYATGLLGLVSTATSAVGSVGRATLKGIAKVRRRGRNTV